MNSGETIVLDRYWWSTAVYGSMSGISGDVLEALITAERLCWGALQPLVVFLIDCHRPWRESEDTPAWHQMAQEYRNLAHRERTRSNAELVHNHIAFDEVLSRMANSVTKMVRSTVRGGASNNTVKGGPLLCLPPNERTPPQPRSTVLSMARLEGLKPPNVFDTYWHFAFERQEIFFRRSEDVPPHWSADPIL